MNRFAVMGLSSMAEGPSEVASVVTGKFATEADAKKAAELRLTAPVRSGH